MLQKVSKVTGKGPCPKCREKGKFLMMMGISIVMPVHIQSSQMVPLTQNLM